jgi:hypothetical protein
VTELFAAVVSIAPTRRRRFLWAAWWTAAPSREPFLKPDASAGGARTRDEALRQAEAAAGRVLVEVEGTWARAWGRMLMDQPPFPAGAATDTATGVARPARRVDPASIWATLGVEQHATLEQIRAAYRQRALTTHPDRGGDPVAFRALHDAYDEALARRARAAKRPRRRAR